MIPTPIQTQEEFEVATKRIQELSNAPPGTVDTDELEALLLVVNAWQDAHPDAMAAAT